MSNANHIMRFWWKFLSCPEFWVGFIFIQGWGTLASKKMGYSKNI